MYIPTLILRILPISVIRIPGISLAEDTPDFTTEADSDTIMGADSTTVEMKAWRPNQEISS
ncbi:hypothetical protein D3C85_1607740 [compost metagenome]